MNPDEDDAKGATNASFADLIGETRRLRDAKERVPLPASSKPRGPHAKRSTPGPFRWPDPEQPRLAAAPGVNDKRLAELRRGEPAPEERIDLHGVRSDAASRLLVQRLDSAMARGLHCVLVIHGKGTSSGSGDSILRENLPDWLTKSRAKKVVAAFAPAPARLGGDGATLVLLASPSPR